MSVRMQNAFDLGKELLPKCLPYNFFHLSTFLGPLKVLGPLEWPVLALGSVGTRRCWWE